MSSGEEVRPGYYWTDIQARYLQVPDEYGAVDLPKGIVHVECQGVIEGLDLNFNLGSALKYLWRAGRKEGAAREEDISKALTYLKFEVQRLED